MDPITAIRVIEAINQRDKRQREATVAPTALAAPPRPRQVPAVNAAFDQLGGGLANALWGNPSIGGGRPREPSALGQLPPPQPVAAPQTAAAATANAALGNATVVPPATAMRPDPVPATPTATSPLPGGLGLPTLDFASGVGPALDAPRGAVAADTGQDMYDFVTGDHTAVERFLYENIPFRRKVFEWAAANQKLVIDAHEKGYRSRDGATTFTGGRAVWEAYARENLTGNLEGAITSVVMDPLNLIGGPGKTVGGGIARSGAKMAASAGDDLLRLAGGRAIQGAGTALALPDRGYDAALDVVGQVVGGTLRGAGNQARKTRVGAQVGRFFEDSPQAQARKWLNDLLAARAQQRVAQARQRRVLDPHGVSPNGQITTPAPPAPGLVAQEPLVYEEAFSGGPRGTATNTNQAAARARNRLMALRDAAPEGAWRERIDGIWTDLAATRDEINRTRAEAGAGGYRERLWLAEFEADRAARDVLREAGVAEPVYRNAQPTNSLAAQLDTLAWNPDEEAAALARERIQAEEARRASGGVDTQTGADLATAREAAEANRVRFGGVATQEAPPPTRLAPETETPDAHLEGLPEPDQAAFRAGRESRNGRAADFQAADVRLSQAWERLSRVGAEAVSEADELAATTYEEAVQGASRLLEIAKREDDAMDLAFASGSTTPPDVRSAISGGGEQARAAMNAADESFTLGPIVAPEAGDVLGRTFSEANQTYIGRTYGEVADELEAQVTTDKSRLVALLSRPAPELAAKERAELNRLLKRYPGVTKLSDAVALDTDKAFKRQLLDAFEAEAGVGTPNRFMRGAETASRIYSAVNLLMPWNFVRYYLGNLNGDNAAITLVHGLEATAAANNVMNLRDMTRYAQGGGDPLVGAVGDAARGWGLGGFHPSLVTENLAEAMWNRERSAINRAGGRSRFNLIGGVDQATGWMTNPFRNLANGMEWAHRTGLWMHLMDMEAVGRKTSFVTEMGDLLRRHGLAEDDLRTVLDSHLRIDGAEVADSIGRLVLERGGVADEARGVAEEVGRRWASEVYKADEAARKGVNQSLFSYEQTNADRVMRTIVPFHMWMSRAIPFYAEQAIRHPGFAASYYRLYEATKEKAQAEGWPAPLQTFLQMGEGAGGMLMFVNPIAMIGVLDFAFEVNGGYTAENVSAVGNVLSRFSEYGATLLPWWGGLFNYLGYLGESPMGLDPIGSHSTRRFWGPAIQFAASKLADAGLIGPEWQRLLDKPLEQKMRDLRSVTSGLGARFLPGAEHIPSSDANAGPVRDLRNILLRNELIERGMTHNEYLRLAAEAERDPGNEAATLVDEIHDTVLDAEMDGGAAYQQAVRDLSSANMLAAGVNAIVPGPKRVRQEEGLATQVMSNAGWAAREGDPIVIPGVGTIPAGVATVDASGEVRIPEGIDARDADFARRWATKYGTAYRAADLERMLSAAQRANQLQNAAPESAAVQEQQNAYHALGSTHERRTLDRYYDILFARDGVHIRGRKRLNDDVKLSREELAALDDDARSALADAWIAEHANAESLARIQELRELYEATHPEFGEYQRWQRDTRNQWGTSAAFRQAAVRANPNYARYIEQETRKLRADGKPPSEIAATLDERGLSLDAYLAYQGRRKSRFDPMPAETGTPLPVASEGAPADALGGGGGFGSGRSWEDRVWDAIADTEAAMAASEAFLGVPITNLPPEFQEGYLNMPGYPEEAKLPSDSWIYDDYVRFYHEQTDVGGDPSLEAFIVATEREQTGEETVPSRYERGVWPPRPAVSPR